MRPFSHFQLILQLDLRWPLTLIYGLWPWYMTLALINKWGFPCCIYDPTLVEIHPSMWKIEPNVNLFSQQTTTTTPTDNNRGQSDPYVSFLLRQATQKGRICLSCHFAVTHGWSKLYLHVFPPFLGSVKQFLSACIAILRVHIHHKHVMFIIAW